MAASRMTRADDVTEPKPWGPFGGSRWKGHAGVYCRVCGWPDVCCSRCEAEEGAEAEHLAARDRQRQALAEAIAFRDECHAYCAIDGCDC